MPEPTSTPPPAAAPSAPPAETAPPAVTAPPAERDPSAFMADEMLDFEAMDQGKPEPSRDNKGKFVKGDATKPPADVTKPPADSTKPPKDETPPAAGDKPPTRMKELGARYDELKSRVTKELEPRIAELQSKLKEYEAGPSRDAVQLQARVKQLEEANAALDQRLAFMDYSQGREYQTKYEQPYREAWNDALTEFSELRVREADPEGDPEQPSYKYRPATDKDLLKLANMSLSEMDEAAQSMFGASASRAIGHIQNIKRLHGAKQKALTEAQGKAGEYRQQQQAEFQKRASALADTWLEVNKGLQAKFPRAFAAEDGNAEDKAGHTRGFALADLLFLGPQALNPEQIESLPSTFKEAVKAGKPLTETQKVQLHALARLKMANHDRQLARIKSLQAKVKELESSLADYEKSSPGGKAGDAGGGKGGEQPWSLETAEKELAAMDK